MKEFFQYHWLNHSVYFTDKNTGWAVGYNGTILHTTNGGVTFIEEEEIDEIPTSYSLTNNYPNPFNPNTKIKYSVPQTSNVVIKVFDILGNEIETFVNEQKPIGNYEINFNEVRYYVMLLIDERFFRVRFFISPQVILKVRWL